MQTFIVTMVFGTLTILFGSCVFMPMLIGLIHNRGYKIKTIHILGFVFSAYILAMEYKLVPPIYDFQKIISKLQ